MSVTVSVVIFEKLFLLVEITTELLFVQLLLPIERYQYRVPVPFRLRGDHAATQKQDTYQRYQWYTVDHLALAAGSRKAIVPIYNVQVSKSF
jgi:hypothetical protein